MGPVLIIIYYVYIIIYYIISILKVSRHISKMLNDDGNDGVLEGNWTGDYRGGTNPSKWTGSAEILAKFNKDKKTVKYAQCWVFSGVQTTCENNQFCLHGDNKQ